MRKGERERVGRKGDSWETKFRKKFSFSSQSVLSVERYCPSQSDFVSSRFFNLFFSDKKKFDNKNDNDDNKNVNRDQATEK